MPIDETDIALMAATVASGLVIAGKERADDYSGFVVETSVQVARAIAAEVERTAVQPGGGPWTIEEPADVQVDRRKPDEPA